MSAEPTSGPRDADLAHLRSQVSALEAELAEQSVRTAALRAQAQRKLDWLERWDIDLDRVMARPGAVPALDALKQLRRVARAGRRLKRRLTGS